MEGYSPTFGCSFGCTGCYRGWVPRPRLIFPRRDALIDAVGRTDNPCDRPARHPPCCKAVPKFRPPRELPVCDINCFKAEQREAKAREEYEEWLKAGCSCTPLNQCLEVETLDPANHPLICCPDPEVPPTHLFRYREQSYRTDFLAGFFNPDDNKSQKEQLQEQCDKYWIPCGPRLKPYPERGVIRFPQKRWVSQAEENKTCGLPEICRGTKYLEADYMAEQEDRLRDDAQKKLMKRQEESCQAGMARFEKKWGTCYKPPCPCCPSGKCGCD